MIPFHPPAVTEKSEGGEGKGLLRHRGSLDLERKWEGSYLSHFL